MKHNALTIGQIGESVAVKSLENNGFTVLERNYRMPWGEIDIIARKGRTIHFVEVKTASYKSRSDIDSAVSYETADISERIDRKKLDNLKSVIQTYCREREFLGKKQLDAIFVHIVPHETYAAVKYVTYILGEPGFNGE